MRTTPQYAGNLKVLLVLFDLLVAILLPSFLQNPVSLESPAVALSLCLIYVSTHSGTRY